MVARQKIKWGGNAMKKVFIHPISKEKALCLSSQFFDEDIRFLASEGIHKVIITDEYFNLEQRNLLKNLPNIPSMFFGLGTFDLQLSDFKNVNNLEINGTKGTIVFEDMNNLNNLFLVYDKGVSGIGKLSKVKVFVFRDGRDKSFNWQENFSGLMGLEKLELTDCYLPLELEFLSNCQQLKELEIYLNPKPFRLQAMQRNTQL